jgi:hypothetical protein
MCASNSISSSNSVSHHCLLSAATASLVLNLPLVCMTSFHTLDTLKLFSFYRKTVLASFYQEIELHQQSTTLKSHLDLLLAVS